jgi:hypothetical protein
MSDLPSAQRTLRTLEEYGHSRIAFWENPPRGECQEPDCSEKDAILHEKDSVQYCAHHYRVHSNRDEAYPCDHCGHRPAFRDPLARKNEMFCMDCHARQGYIPGERAMISKLVKRQGVEHPMARRIQCSVAGTTPCKGQVKQRGKIGVLCDRHVDPVKYDKARQP